MVELKKEQMESLIPLFRHMTDTLIWSCIQGYMGRAWVDSAESPRSAKILTADFCFVAGEPNQELAEFLPLEFKKSVYFVMKPSAEWVVLLRQTFGARLSCFPRYAMKQDSSGFDRDKLAALASNPPEGYELCLIDGTLYEEALSMEWSKDFCSNFASAEDYAARGLGIAAVKDGILCAAASSYTIYSGGIEIEIGTWEPHRKKGLARACGAALILACLDQGLCPSWDAANKVSCHLAQVLGYQFDREYEAYAIQARKPSLLKHCGTVPLETERLLLRRFRLTDEEAVFHNWASDPEVTKYLTWRAHGDRKVTRDVLESWCGHYTEKTYHWALTLKETDEPVGSVGLVKLDEETLTGEFGYALSRNLWGRGIMPEAMQRLLRYWFEEIGFDRIVGKHDVDNPKSGRVMEKIGLRRTCLLPGGAKDNQGNIVDVQKWKITREEWRAMLP